MARPIFLTIKYTYMNLIQRNTQKVQNPFIGGQNNLFRMFLLVLAEVFHVSKYTIWAFRVMYNQIKI